MSPRRRINSRHRLPPAAVAAVLFVVVLLASSSGSPRRGGGGAAAPGIFCGPRLVSAQTCTEEDIRVGTCEADDNDDFYDGEDLFLEDWPEDDSEDDSEDEWKDDLEDEDGSEDDDLLEILDDDDDSLEEDDSEDDVQKSDDEGEEVSVPVTASERAMAMRVLADPRLGPKQDLEPDSPDATEDAQIRKLLATEEYWTKYDEEGSFESAATASVRRWMGTHPPW